jgi:TonB family protein
MYYDATPPASLKCVLSQSTARCFVYCYVAALRPRSHSQVGRKWVVCDMRNLSALRFVIRWLLLVYLISFGSVSLLNAQPPTPTISLPRAVYAPKPVYRPEWSKQGLKGKGVVLVTIDTKTGKVSGVQMAQSTGSQLLDGAALQAYSQWRFEPGSVSQVKMPFEFTNRPQTAAKAAQTRPISYWLQIVGIVVVLFALMKFLSRRLRVGRAKPDHFPEHGDTDDTAPTPESRPLARAPRRRRRFN